MKHNIARLAAASPQPTNPSTGVSPPQPHLSRGAGDPGRVEKLHQV
jgi:hypothetical protein